MTLQWTLVSWILYSQVAATLVLLLPWISPLTWKKIFKSRVAHAVVSQLRTASFATGAALLLLFVDAVRETNKYSHIEAAVLRGDVATIGTDVQIHANLFHAQRNFYVTGFTLLLFLVNYRIVKLLFRTGLMQQSAEAAMRQAQSASDAGIREMNGEAAKKEQKVTEELKAEIERTLKERNAVKVQAEELQKEYEELRKRL